MPVATIPYLAPTELSPEPGPLPNSPKKAQQWRRRHIASDPATKPHEICQLLQRLYLSPPPAADFLATLEVLQPLLLHYSNTLSNALINQALPIKKKGQQLFIQHQHMHQYLASNYYRVLMLDDNERPLTAQQKAMALTRTMTSLTAQVRACALLYQSVPKLLWQTIHSLYKKAEQDGISEYHIVDDSCPDQTLLFGPMLVYQRLLAFSLARPAGLRANESIALFHWLSEMANHVVIGMPIDQTPGSLLYAVSLDSDQAPDMPEKLPPHDLPAIRTIDLKMLAKYLQEDSAKQLPILSGLSLDGLLHTLQAWCLKRQNRRHRRIPRRLNVQLAFGINTIHQEIPPNWQQINNEACNWRMMDASLTGYYLQRRTPTPYPLQVGEIVGLRERDSDSPLRWRICIIRWLNINHQEKRFTIGLELISKGAASIRLRLSTDPEPPFPALLLPQLGAAESPSSLVFHSRYACQTGDTMHMGERPLRLGKLLNRSYQIQRYQAIFEPTASHRLSDTGDHDQRHAR